jgi:tight adherence protein B
MLYAAVFFVVAAGVWAIRAVINAFWEEQFRKTFQFMSGRLDDLFFQVTDRTVNRILACTVILFAITGFFFPGNISNLDRILLDEAVGLNRQGKFQQSMIILNRFANSSSPLAHNELGYVEMSTGDFKAALKEFRRASELYPEYVQPHVNAAIALNGLGRTKEAAFEMTRARELEKFTPDANKIYGVESGILSNFIARIVFMVIFAVAGFYFPGFVIKRLVLRRQKQFDELLPDGLLMAANALRAGMSLTQALDVVAKEAPRPLNQEFRLVLKEHRLGKDLKDALWNLAERMPTEDTKILVNSINILRETGGNLTEIFDNLAYTMRERKMLKQKIMTMTAEGRAQAVILTALPVVLGLILNKLNPESFSLMYTTVVGWAIMIFMFIWGLIGCFFMWKAVQIKI